MFKIILAYMLLLISLPLLADDNKLQQTSLSYMYGEGYKLTSEANRSTIKFEDIVITDNDHLLYFNANLASFNDSNSTITTRLLGHYHLINQVSLAGQIINQPGISSTDAGISFKLPLRRLFMVDFYKHSDNFLGKGYKILSYWNIPVPNFDKVSFSGFYEITWSDKLNRNMVLSQPQIMYEYSKDTFVGVEYQVYINKYNLGLDEYIPQLKLTKTF
jgi:hypothetical protein